ncbi:XPP2 aminopeptidase, partial [Aramus guarauna]|nr:XPP2 aminopeptidase [Aramus guarauna]
NAALAHYSPSNGSSRKLSVDEMYLSDTGGQYLDGTTDITRTVHWGVPTPLQKVPDPPMPASTPRGAQHQGPLASSLAPIPSRHSPGRNVESFARRALWDVGLNYGHGTGHGIGNFLSVHEWPVGFQSNNVPLTAGMFTSIEPGYYRDGEFGIRIEDVALVAGAAPLQPPDDARLQIRYLNAYYETIRASVGPELQRQQLEEEYRWLQRSTEP